MFSSCRLFLLLYGSRRLTRLQVKEELSNDADFFKAYSIKSNGETAAAS